MKRSRKYAWIMAFVVGVGCTRGPFSLEKERRVIDGPLKLFSERVAPYSPLGGNSEYLLIGTLSGDIELRSITNGKIIWRKSLGSVVTSQPTICKQSVIVGLSDSSVYSLSLQTGKQQWVYQGPSSMVGRISCSETHVYVGSNQGHFYALALDTGTPSWSLRQDPGDRMTVQAFPLIDHEKDSVLVAFSSGAILSVDKDGNTLWSSGLNGKGLSDFKDITAISRLSADTVYVSQYEGQGGAIRDADGKSVWELENGGSLPKSIVEDASVYIPLANQGVAMADKGTGSITWQWQGPSGPGWVGFAVYKTYVLASSGDGNLYVLEKQTGRYLWKYNFGSPLMGDAVVTPSGFWVLSQKGQLVKFSE